MKASDPNVQNFSVIFDGSNNFICGTTQDRKTVAKETLEHLEAEHGTVIITDPYLFCSHSDAVYEQDLLEILKSLKADKIIYCAEEKKNDTFFANIMNSLKTVNCQLVHNASLTDCHDRFWFCPEKDRAVVFGTSLNGLCRKICRIEALRNDEVNELKRELQSRGILE